MIGTLEPAMPRLPRQAASFGAILCPVDFSTHSRLALQYAVALARRSKGRVTALHVNNPLLIAAAAAAAYDERELLRTSGAELKRFVARAVGKGDAARVEPVVMMGEASREILKEADRLPADLIVMGTQGLSGAGRLFFGSTTERVLRDATVPILAVPPRRKGSRLSPSWPGPRVLAAIDLNDAAPSDARAAAAIARRFDVDLVLAHVVSPEQAPEWLVARLRSHRKDRLAHARAALARMAGELDEVRVETRVLLGDPADQVSALAADTRAGLVIVALRRGEGLFGAAQGSMTYRVLSGGGSIPILGLPTPPGASGSQPATVPDPSAFT
jgi:nucleotide-binding universal stress UspA family protein